MPTVLTLTGTAATAAFDENAIQTTAQTLFADVTFTATPEMGETVSFDGGALTLTGLAADDIVTVADSAALIVNGANIEEDGSVIGTIAGGNGTDLTITFNALADATSIELIVESLTFQSTSDTPVAERELVLDISDADGANLGAPAGTLSTFVQIAGAFPSTTTQGYQNIATLDIDGDGDIDVVSLSRSQEFEIWDNTDGAGTFEEVAIANSALSPLISLIQSSPRGDHEDIVSDDFDGDGDTDLAFVLENGALRVFSNNDNDLGFTELTGSDNPLNGVVLPNRATFAYTDIDEDGDKDVVYNTFSQPNPEILIFDDLTGTFSAATDPRSILAVNGESYWTTMFAVDIDNDGDEDLVFGSSTQSNIRYYENNNDDNGYTLIVPTLSDLETGGVSNFPLPHFADLDGDGDLDAVIGQTNTSPARIDAYENTSLLAPSIAITINAEDDPLDISGLPTSLDADEDVPTAIDMSGVTITDPDATGPITLSFTAANGTITIVDAEKDAAVAVAQAAKDSADADVAAAQAALAAAEAVNDAADADVIAAESALNLAEQAEAEAQLEADQAQIDFNNMLITQAELDAALLALSEAQSAVTIANDAVNAAYDAQAIAESAVMDATAALADAETAASDAQTALDEAEAMTPLVEGTGTGEVTVTGLPAELDTVLTTEGAVQFTGATDAFGEAADSIEVALVDGMTSTPLGTIAVNLAEQIDERAPGEAADAGRDIMAGTEGADRLNGLEGTDTLNGGAGNDRLDGGADADAMNGGLGNDTYYVDNVGDVVSETTTFSQGGGYDTVYSSIDYTIGANVEAVRLTGEAINASGNGGNNIVVGNELDNTLSGGGGNDLIAGKAGADVLIGNAGSDILVGGFGVDTFMFTSIADSRAGASNRDTINGFVHAAEKIDLSAIDANTYNGAATTDEWTFIGTRAFDGTWGSSAGQLRTQGLGEGVNAILVEGDHNGDGVADFQIFINGTHWMTGTDFIL